MTDQPSAPDRPRADSSSTCERPQTGPNSTPDRPRGSTPKQPRIDPRATPNQLHTDPRSSPGRPQIESTLTAQLIRIDPASTLTSPCPRIDPESTPCPCGPHIEGAKVGLTWSRDNQEYAAESVGRFPRGPRQTVGVGWGHNSCLGKFELARGPNFVRSWTTSSSNLHRIGIG